MISRPGLKTIKANAAALAPLANGLFALTTTRGRMADTGRRCEAPRGVRATRAAGQGRDIRRLVDALRQANETETFDSTVYVIGEQGAVRRRQAQLAEARVETTERADTLLFMILLAGSIACAVGGVVAALLLAASVSRRINRLARNADRLARGEAIETEPVGRDEIGQLDRRLREAARLLREREGELRAQAAELESANRELEAFSYSVSHDLRAPLRAIDGFSQMVEQEHGPQLDDEGRDALRRVRTAAQRMGALIDELLNLSRLTRSDLRRERLDLGAAAAGIIDDLVRHHPSRSVDVTSSRISLSRPTRTSCASPCRTCSTTPGSTRRRRRARALTSDRRPTAPPASSTYATTAPGST